MDGLPLAIDQAGAYVEETSCGLTTYLDLYQKRGTALLARRGGVVLDHPEPVATTGPSPSRKSNSRVLQLLN
jgi:hypothetical protein